MTLVHFWATWCPPCVEESPSLERLSKDFAGRPGFRLVRIAVEDAAPQVERFLGPDAADVLYDPQWDVAHRFGTHQLPETYLMIDGEVAEKFIGATNWDDPAVRQKLLAALAGGKPSA